MPARWQEWNKAKQDMAQEKSAKKSAVDEALSIVRGTQKVAKDDPNALRCPVCGGMKFKTRNKGAEWACRSCGKVIQKGAS